MNCFHLSLVGNFRYYFIGDGESQEISDSSEFLLIVLKIQCLDLISHVFIMYCITTIFDNFIEIRMLTFFHIFPLYSYYKYYQLSDLIHYATVLKLYSVIATSILILGNTNLRYVEDLYLVHVFIVNNQNLAWV